MAHMEHLLDEYREALVRGMETICDVRDAVLTMADNGHDWVDAFESGIAARRFLREFRLQRVQQELTFLH